MNRTRQIGIVLGCTLGGALLAEGLLVLVALFWFGIHAPEPFVRFIAATSPMGGFAGGCFGFFLAQAIGRRPRA